MYMSALGTHLLSMEDRQGIRSPRIGITNSYKPPCKYWESNLHPQKEQSVFLTAKPSLQPSIYTLNSYIINVLRFSAE